MMNFVDSLIKIDSFRRHLTETQVMFLTTVNPSDKNACVHMYCLALNLEYLNEFHQGWLQMKSKYDRLVAANRSDQTVIKKRVVYFEREYQNKLLVIERLMRELRSLK